MGILLGWEESYIGMKYNFVHCSFCETLPAGERANAFAPLSPVPLGAKERNHEVNMNTAKEEVKSLLDKLPDECTLARHETA